jgi:LemA protein
MYVALGLLGVALLFVVIGGLSWWGTYSSLNTGFYTVQEKAADVGSTLQRRYDLIPNLVSAVKGYAKHENSVFKDVTEARAKVGQVNINTATTSPEQMKKFAAAQGEMSSALSRLLLVQEKYPDLKANQNFLDLQSQLEGTENRINEARHRYNKAVKDYNITCGGLFSQIVANVHGFKKAENFEAAEAAKTAPKVEF